MRKLKVYLDTSVISHLMQEDVPEKMADTLHLWKLFREGIYGTDFICDFGHNRRSVECCTEND